MMMPLEVFVQLTAGQELKRSMLPKIVSRASLIALIFSGLLAGCASGLSRSTVLPPSGSVATPAATTRLSPARLLAPGGLVVAKNGSQSVQLLWDPVDGADAYSVYRNTTPHFAQARLIGRTTAPLWVDYTISPNTRYYYWVTATRGRQASGPSTLTTVVTDLSWQAIHAQAEQSVVHVSTYTTLLGIFGPSITGTGWFGPNGDIVTCDHMVHHAHYLIDIRLHVSLGTAPGPLHAHIVAQDPAQDLALLKLDSGMTRPALPIDSSSSLYVGQAVGVLGYPGGEALTMTVGRIVAVNQTVTVQGYGTLSGVFIYNAGAVGGNSGSPIFNRHGQVIGIEEGAGVHNGNYDIGVPVKDLAALGVPIHR